MLRGLPRHGYRADCEVWLQCHCVSAERGGLTKTFLCVFGTRQLGMPRLGYETREYFIIEYGFILINIFIN